MSKRFYSNFNGAAKKQPAVGFLLERDLISWSLAIDEHGGYGDLRGSGRQNVIPYVHGRMKLYYSSLSCLSLFPHRREVAPARTFYNSMSGSYIETRSLTGGPEVIETLYIT
jgi:hypothetical protein